MSKILYILLAIVVLLVLITVHEFGHYCAGKIFHFKINELSIGFGPAIFKRKRKDGEIFSIRALPLGGFCAFEGEDDEGVDAEGKTKVGAFNSMAAWKRLVVLLAGVSFNFLFAVLTSAIYLMVSGFSTVQVTSIVNQQGVVTTGFQKYDIVLAVDGKKVEAHRSFGSLIAKYGQDEEFTVTVERDGKIVDFVSKKQKFPAFYFVSYNEYYDGKIFLKDGDNYVPLALDTFIQKINSESTASETTENAGTGEALRSYLSTVYFKDGENYYTLDTQIETLLKGDADKGIYASITYSKSGTSIGIIQQYVARDYSFFGAIGRAFPYAFYLCGMIISSLFGLFSGAISVSEAGGTITAVSQIAQISEMGIEYFLLLLPLLSANLAVFNVLPIPSLDGARSVFVLIEIIFRKPVPRHIEGWIHTIGLFALLALVVFLDINHFATASYILQL